MIDEIVRQLLLFKNDEGLFRRYINQYTVSCLIDSNSSVTVTKCTEGVTRFLSDVMSTDIGKNLLNNNSLIQKTLLETNMASIEKFKVDTSELQININNQFVRVRLYNLGRILRRSTAFPNLFKFDPSTRVLPTVYTFFYRKSYIQCIRFSIRICL